MTGQDAQRLLKAGVQYAQAGKWAQAEVALKGALEVAPGQPEILGHLARVQQQQGKLEEAIRLADEAWRVMPGHAGVAFLRGNILMALRRFSEAAGMFEAALKAQPGLADGFVALGFARLSAGDNTGAGEAWSAGLRLHPENAVLHSNYAAWLLRNGRAEESVAHCKRAAELQPNLVGAHGNLANTLSRLGRMDEAIASYRRGWEVDRSDRRILSGLVFAMQYRVTDPAAMREPYRAWAAALRAPAPGPFENVRDPERRLRIGYLSPDFRRHVVAQFMEPIFERRSRAAFEVFCYAEVEQPDEVTQRFQALSDGWRSTVGKGPAEVAAHIRADGIDVLIDLALHTSGNRLDIMALKPAPVQATYLGYSGTTGLPAIDYVLLDRYLAPDRVADEFCVEKVWRLESTYFCYRAPADAPEITALPAKTHGYITFGSFNTFGKISPDAMALWARVLHALPGSRIIFKTPAFDEPGPRAYVEKTMAALGIAPERMSIHGKTSMRDYFSEIAAVDICLDTLPYSGGTTTCNALWMGVPVVTLGGKLPISRMSSSSLSNAGFTDLVTETPGAFVARCQALAANLNQLAALRASTRERMKRSALMDETAATHGIEAAYRGMWRKFCDPGRGGQVLSENN